MPDSALSRADAAAQSVGASDLFVLRRVGEGRFVHFGGSGRGAGWAGLIEVAVDDEQPLAEALRAAKTVRIANGGRELVFGPYYARAAAFVPLNADVVVVFGCQGNELDTASDESLLAAAHLAADEVETVTSAKRLADELEELEAVRAALAVDLTDTSTAMRGLADVTAASLACEYGAIYLDDGEQLEVGVRGWEPEASKDQVRAALRSALEEARLPYCVQDARAVPLPAPLDAEQGVRSYYLLELRGTARGVVLVAHTDVNPRGFTLLCRRLGLRLADVVAARLGVALTQEWCSAEASRLQVEFAKLSAG